MTTGLLDDPDALTLILQQLRVANNLTEGLDALDSVAVVNRYAFAHLRANKVELARDLLGVDMGMSPLGLATMIRQMSPTHRDRLVHLAEQWNTPHVIEDRSFINCTALAIKTLSPLLTAIVAAAFAYCTALDVVEWHAPELTTVDHHAFFRCTKMTLETWNTPKLEDIVEGATFDGCSALVLSTWDAPKLTAIPAFAFNGCANLTLKKWGAPLLSSIGMKAFVGCTSLEWPDGCPFPASVAITNGAFHGCTGLSLVARSQIEDINPDAFIYIDLDV